MVKLSDIDLPVIFENRLLFSHGFHNNLNILPEEVVKSLANTNWSDQRNRSLFFSHHERDAQKWVGRINNPRVENGELYGDLEIHDADLALKIGPGRAPIGVSAEIRWPMQYPNPTNFSYRGFAMVPNPEVPETMLNFSKAKEDGFNSATLHTPFVNESVTFSEEVVEDKNKEVSDEKTKGEESISVEVEEAKDKKPEVEYDTDNSNLMSAERGLNKKMENNANNVEEEVKETAEEVTNEEAEVVEESKEDAKADFSEIKSAIESLSARISILEEKQAKFSETEEEEESKDEESEDEESEDEEESKEDVVAEEESEVKTEEVKAEEVEAEEVEAEESKEDVAAEEESEVKEDAKADFSQALFEKIDKLADAIAKKEAAPMTTAEFGNKVNNREDAVIDRLTKSLSK